MPKKTRLSDISRAGQKPDEPSVIGAIRDPQFVRDIMAGLRDVSGRAIAGTVGAPVDLATMAMRPLGYSVPAEQVIGGSEWIGQKMQNAGMISPARNPVAEMITGLATPSPAEAATLGAMFIGPLAKVWDAKAAARAVEMEKAGMDPRAIWAETGTWRGPGGQLRQEVSDVEAKMIPQTGKPLEYMQDFSSTYPSELQKVMSHEKAYEAYPDLPGVRAVMQTGPGAGYAPPRIQKERIEFPFRHRRDTGEIFNPEESKSMLLHEMQHAIQEREGFATGGNPSLAYFDPEFMKKLNAKIEKLPESKRNNPAEVQKIRDKMSYDYYMKLGGEAEARATQARMNMTPEQRMAVFPGESFDVPIKSLLNMSNEEMMSRVPKTITMGTK